MKKLLLLLPLILLGCSGMDYTYEYVTEQTADMQPVSVNISVIEQQEPNVFILETRFKTETLTDINAISLKINYDADIVEFVDSVKINEKLYINEFDNPDLIGITLYNITETQICYSFATVQDTYVDNEFIFKQAIKIHGETEFLFSKVTGDVEFMAFDGSIYPLKITYVKFIKK